MSFRDMRQHLEDIRDNIEAAESFTDGVTLDQYKENELVRSAVERKVEIVAEAACRLGEDASKVDAEHNWKALKALGNVLRHAYHRIDDEMMWSVLKDDFPLLKRSVKVALEALPDEEE